MNTKEENNIIDYLQGRLSVEDRHAFEARIMADAEFAKEVEFAKEADFWQNISFAMSEEGEAYLNMVDSTKSIVAEEYSKLLKKEEKRNRVLWIFAILFLLVLASLALYSVYAPSPDNTSASNLNKEIIKTEVDEENRPQELQDKAENAGNIPVITNPSQVDSSPPKKVDQRLSPESTPEPSGRSDVDDRHDKVIAAIKEQYVEFKTNGTNMSGGSDPVESQFNLAVTAFNSNNYNTALLILDSLVINNPASNPFRELRASVNFQLKNYQQVIEDLERLSEDRRLLGRRAEWNLYLCYLLIDSPQANALAKKINGRHIYRDSLLSITEKLDALTN